METKKILALLAVAGFCFFTSCKDDEVSPLTANEAQLAITSADDEFVSVKGEVLSTPGMMAQETIYGLGLPFSPPMKSLTSLNPNQILLLKDFPIFAERKGGYEPDYIYFAFNDWVGTWEKEEGVWTRVSTTPTDKIVVEFSFNGGTNNATLTFSDYQTKPVPYAGKGEENYITQLKAKIEIDGQTNPVMTWVYTANRTLTGGNLKTVTNLGSVYSLTEQESANTNNSGVITVDYLFEARKNSEVIFSKSFNMTFEGLSKNTGSDFSVNVTAKVRIVNVVIYYTIFINQDTDTSNPGNFMTVTLKLTNGAKVADVIFEGEYHEPYFKFSDGTKVKVMDTLSEDLLNELEDFMDSLSDYFG